MARHTSTMVGIYILQSTCMHGYIYTQSFVAAKKCGHNYTRIRFSDGSVYFSHAHLKTPSSKDDIITIVRTAAARGEKVRVLGSGHSWSTVAVSEDVLVSLWNYTGIVSGVKCWRGVLISGVKR